MATHENVQHNKCNSIRLRDYQQRGVDWMYSLHKRKVNGILADEMGLGKTIQTIQFLHTLLLKKGVYGPHLIVMPLSVITSWQTDLKKFGNNDFNVYTHHGNKEVRQDAFQQWYHKIKKKFNTNSITQVYVCLTTYEVVIKDEFLLRKLSTGVLKWAYLVVDEAHRLKNKDSLLFEILDRLHYGRRLLLTGTPLQNNLAELWALLSFILPNQVFNTKEDIKLSFQEQFEYDSADDTTTTTANTNSIGSNNTTKSKYYSKLFRFLPGNTPDSSSGPVENPVESNPVESSLSETGDKQEIISQIHALLKPYLLRRVKADVAVEIPPKIEKVIYCPLSALQTEVYQRFRHSVLESSYNKRILYNKYASNIYGPYEKALTNVNNLLIQLRKLCNHPYLVLEDVNTIPDALYYQYLIQSSGKMYVLDKILTQLLAQNSKVLIFSQMTSMLDILQGYLQLCGVRTARLDGNTAQEQRQSQLKAFNSPVAKQASRRYAYSTSINSSSNSTKSEEEEETYHTATPTGTSSKISSYISTTPTTTTATPTSTTTPIIHQQDASTTAAALSISEEEDYSVFLLSTRAGGVGINLQAADTVILFDSDWNPQQDLQAISRAHRIGQNKTVLVLRFVSIGPDDSTYSVEQRILRRANKKLEIGQSILVDGMFDHNSNSNCRPSLSKDTSKMSNFEVHSENIHNSEDQPVELCDTIYSLFETITDTESVSTTTSSGLPISAVDNSTLGSDHSSASIMHKSRFTKQQDALINMYKLDFSAKGIDSICNREAVTISTGSGNVSGSSSTCMTSANDTTCTTSTTDTATVADVEELRRLMGQCDISTWDSWLDPPSSSTSQDPDLPTQSHSASPSQSTHPGTGTVTTTAITDTGGGSAEVGRDTSPSLRHRATRGNNSSNIELSRYLDEDEGLHRASKRKKSSVADTTSHSIGKGRVRTNYNEDEAWRMLLGEFKKNRRGVAAGKGIAEVGFGLEGSGRKRRRKAASYVTADSSSSDSDSSRESYHSNSNSNSNSSTEEKPHSRSRTKKVSSDHPPPTVLQATDLSGLQADDICTICGQAWVTSAELEIYLDCKMQRQLEKIHQIRDNGNPLEGNRDLGNSPSVVEVSGSLPESNKSDPSEMLNMMLLCDGCNGSYHMICVGMDSVTDGAWYCQLCKYVT